jgi:predicted ATPase
MTVKRIQIRNFKAFKDACVKDLEKMNVFLGVNGSGKTSLFDVFGFLKDALQNNMTVAVNRRGGFPQVLARGCKTKTDTIFIEIEFTDTDGESFNYSIEIAEKLGKAIIRSEILKKHSGSLNILEFHNGKGNVIANEKETKPVGYNTASPDILAIKGLGQFEIFEAVSSLRALLEKCYLSDFRIEYGRNISDTGLSEHLSASGDNLAQVTKYMYEYHPEVFGSILEKLPLRIPGVKKAEAKETEDGRIALRFQDEHFKDPFMSRYVSDGTIKMFAYMILLYDPEPHPLLCIEEPENFLHPDLLPELCEEIRGYADRGGQVFVSTHSPDFVNGVRIEELYYLEKENGYTQVKAVRDNELARSLSEENQLGWLWRNRYIQGAGLK